MAPASRSDFRIGWICALPVEMAAATAMLDETFPPLPNRKDDHNKYILGRVGQHTIVITCLPAGIYGTTSATATAFHMRYSFESIDVCFMVGIGGGAPGKHDIRLGDIVVSEPFGRYGGVVHYDRGKIVDGGRTMLTGALGKPPDAVLRTLCALKAHHFHTISQVLEYYHEALQRLPLLQETMPYPGTDTDQLFFSGYPHVFPYSDCHMCDQSKIKQRAARPDTRPRVFYGLIASGDKVIKDATTRDQLAQEHDILCFETEAAGLMDIFPCLVVRGICDYADSHKNKQWQGYAAAVAAAYTKELLLFLPYYETPPPRTPPFQDTMVDTRPDNSQGFDIASPTPRRSEGIRPNRRTHRPPPCVQRGRGTAGWQV
ncbi:nucleoside phosphorylase domain-containing protein [Aspergillus karnatakaensis]|uniref:nucleoside phosphorylase domain-containing protein n=1 Tax=Aspergillus karnatakaensis TaxID=1810916 RepID=UPI003CCD2A2F